MEKEKIFQNVKLLYVEDEEITRREMSKLLKRRIGKLLIAENGKDGLELYHLHKPDVIIVDLIMPELGGLDMIKSIREIDNDCFIMITTALSDKEAILETVNIGISKYIIKPIDTDALSQALEDACKVIYKRKELNAVINLENKRDLENQIKKAFSFFIKKTTGKGPKDVSVFIQGNKLEIKTYSALTPLEVSLIEDGKNTSYVEMNRRLFYSVKNDEIKKMIFEIINYNIEIDHVVVDVKKDVDYLEILIVQV